MNIKDLYQYKEEDTSLIDSMIIHAVNTGNGYIEIQKYDTSKEDIIIQQLRSSFNVTDENSFSYITNKPKVHTVESINEYNNIEDKTTGDIVVINVDGVNTEQFVNIFGELNRISPNIEDRNGILVFNRYTQGVFATEDEILLVGEYDILRSLKDQYIGSLNRTNSTVIEEERSALFYQSDELTTVGLSGTLDTIGSGDFIMEIFTKRKLIALHDSELSDFDYADMYEKIYEEEPSMLEMFSLSMVSNDGSKNKIGFDIAASTFPSKISANFTYKKMKYDDRPVKMGFEVKNKTTGNIEVYDTIEETKSQDDDGNDVWTLTRKTKLSDGTITTQEVNEGTVELVVQQNIDKIDSALLMYIQCLSIDTFKIEFGENNA